MVDDGEFAPPGDGGFQRFQQVVAEFFHPAAGQADEVMVVVGRAGFVDFVAVAAVAEVEFLQDVEFAEKFQGAVYGGQADFRRPPADDVEYVFGRQVAVRVVEKGLENGLALAWIGDAVPYNVRQTTIARFMMGQISGLIVGQAFGGWFGDIAGWRAAFVVILVLYAVATAGLAFELRRNPLRRTRPARPVTPARPGAAAMAANAHA